MTQIYESPYQVDIPVIDVPTFVFSSSVQTRVRPQYFDADNPAENFSLEQAETWVKRWAKGLQDFGIAINDKVMLCSGNSLYFPILLWGVLASGGVFTGCSPTSSVTGKYNCPKVNETRAWPITNRQELSYQLGDSDSRLLLADPACLETAFQAADNVGLPRSRVFVFSRLGCTRSYAARRWTDLWAPGADVANWAWRKFITKEQAESATAVINYSSG